MKISLLESFLLQIVIYSVVWYFNEYVGSLLMIILPPIALSILIIAWMVEKIEKSKIGSAYFKHMVVFIITPILVGGIVVWLFDGNLDWLGD